MIVTPALRWLVILLPLAFLAGPTPPEVIMGIVCVCFLARSALLRDWRWAMQPWFVIFGILWVHFMVSGALSEYPADSIWRGGWWMRYPLFAAALSHWLLRDETTMRRLLAALLAAVAFLIADMFLQFYAAYDLLGHQRIDMSNFIRLTGPFKKPIAGIMLLYLGFPAIFYLLFLAKEKSSRWLGAAGVALVVAFSVAIYLSGERMALLLCLLGLGLSALIIGRFHRWWLAGVGLAVLALVSLVIFSPALRERQIRQTSQEVMHFADSPYGQIWRSAVAVGQDNPLTGVGLKNFRHICPRASYGGSNPEQVLFRCGVHTHNIYLELFAEAGYPGVILFVMAISLWLIACWRARHRLAGDMILAGLMVALVVRVWPLAIVTSQFNPWSAGPFWLFAGLLLARLVQAEKR